MTLQLSTLIATWNVTQQLFTAYGMCVAFKYE